ncbi:hypothetical protein ACFYPQ_05000 [Streptomyces sp. NPDC005522]|uniref:hypothetical protein n=1 Tax=Streptomyces sp. NPDC005522 TaxID=3364719 RepID=UPI0036C07E52
MKYTGPFDCRAHGCSTPINTGGARLVPCAILAWHLAARRGYDVASDLLGDDQPERTAAFCTEVLARLGS